MHYAARQALSLTIVPPSLNYIALSAALLAKVSPATFIGVHAADMREAVARAFSERVDELS